MKYRLDYRVKNIILAACITAIMITLYFCGKEVFITKYEKSNIERLKYGDETSIGYQIYLEKDNMLYDIEKIEEGIAISNFIDYIRVNYKYKYDSNVIPSSNIKGEFILELEGYMGENETRKSIFKKVFDTIEINEKVMKEQEFSGSVDIKCSKYKEFVEELFKNAEMSCSTKLNAKIKIDISAKNEFKNINFTSEPFIEIPINESFIEIVGNKSVSQKDKYVDIISKKIPVNKKRLYAYAVFIVIVLICSILVFLKVDGINRPNKKRKMITKIFKQHGSYMVELTKPIDMCKKEIIQVSSIDDIVRLADEIRKPIFYDTYNDIENVSKFYLMDNETVYIYEICDNVEKGEDVVV